VILRRLAEFASRIPDLPPSMYYPQPIRWQIELDDAGHLLGITLLSGGDSKDRGLTLMAPYKKRSGTAPPPRLLADKAEYVLGFGTESPEQSWHFRQFADAVRKCLEVTDEPTVAAVAAFLEQHKASLIQVPADMSAGDYVTFRVGGVRPIDLPNVRRFWAQANASGDTKMQCIVCGHYGPVDRVSPVPIKGLTRIGGKAEMAISSANEEAFESYGARQSFIAPTCRVCGEAYANSLNYMIKTEHHRVFVEPTVFVFWTREDWDFSPASLLTQPQEEEVAKLIRAYRTGSLPAGLEASAFYALSMSASGNRVVLRDWLETTVPAVQINLGRWFVLQAIVGEWGEASPPVGTYELAASAFLIPKERQQLQGLLRSGRPIPKSLYRKIPAAAPRALVRCALYGGPLPDWMLAQAVGRNRAEQGITRNRAALIKAILLSQTDNLKEDYMEHLDPICKSPGYLCGRVLAEVEGAQIEYHKPRKINTTVVDRFYGAASYSPKVIFGSLLKGLQLHMAKLRKERPAVFFAIDSRLQDIMSDMADFPNILNLKEQARFALGYYHQKAANRAAALKAKKGREHEDSEED